MRLLYPLFSYLVYLSSASEDEFRLIQDLKQNYDSIERPIRNHNASLEINMRIILQQLVDVDEKNQMLTLVVWQQTTWNDYKMRWDPKEYGGITTVQLPYGMLWKPDILLFNTADEHFDASFPVNYVVTHDGSILHAPPGIVKVACTIDITWFPFDEQICHLKYGSWTYSGSKVDLHIDDDGLSDLHKMDLVYYIQNGEWELLGTPAERVEKTFEGEKYVELYFRMHLKRKTLYYGLNWILPSIIISLTNVLGFTLPAEGGEKITLQITNLLSVTVFLGVVSEMTPPTSESIPVIAMFFSISMIILGCSIITTIVIINVNFRTCKTHTMSPWVRFMFLEWLPWLLVMHRPGKTFRKPRVDPRSFETEHSDLSSESSLKRISLRIEDHEKHMLMERQKEMRALPPRLVNDAGFAAIYQPLEAGIRQINESLQWMKDKREEEEAEEDAHDDWRFVGSVLDRLSLYLYSGLIIGTAVFLFIFTPRVFLYGPIVMNATTS